MDRWIEASLRNRHPFDTDATSLSIELSRAYPINHSSGHNFQTVLRVRHRDQPNAPWRTYRGVAAGITWWGSDAEFGRYAERSVMDAVTQLVKSEGRCEATARVPRRQRAR